MPWPSRNPEDYRASSRATTRSVALRRAAWALLALSVILGVIATYYGIGESAESQPNAAAGRAADVLWICAGVAFVVCVPGALGSDSERRRGR